MSDIKIRVQSTPNPNAKKFILSKDVKTEGKISFTSFESCAHIDLARELYSLVNVTQIHFYENVITITQNGLSNWEAIEEQAKIVILTHLPDHDPNFRSHEEERRLSLSPPLRQIEEILDEYIRPSLRVDGGDVEVLDLDNNILTIRYEGACGSCPSSQLGTLEAIRSTLQSEFSSELDVVAI